MKKIILKPNYSANIFLSAFYFFGAILYYTICVLAAFVTGVLGIIAFPFYALQRVQQKLKHTGMEENGNNKNFKLNI